MTNKQILKKAIEKAVKNGWKIGDYNFATQFALNDYPKDMRSQYFIIFSHDFAKAFWGKEEHQYHLDDDYDYEWCEECGKLHSEHSEHCWQYHLQQMVLEEEPLKYIEKFL